MKKTTKLTALLCAAAILCSCTPAQEAETTAPAETTTTASTTTAPSTTTPESSAEAEAPTEEAEKPGADLPRMDGSTSATPLEVGLKAAKLGITFTDAAELVSHTTTHDSFKRLIGGEVDLIFSVPISEDQQKAADEAGVTLFMQPVAKEGFVFVVNAENPVDSLTTEQLKGIYSGEITNWSQVGGNDEPILPYQRNLDSGSQNYMTVFMGDTPLSEPKTEYIATAMGGLMDAIAAYDNAAGAIGYSVYSYAAQMYANANKVKFIAVDGIAPSKATMADESYPLLSATYLIYTDRSAASAREFTEWALSDEGQTAVMESGYLPVNGMEVPEKFLPYEAVGTGTPIPDGKTPDRNYSVVYLSHGTGCRLTGDGYYALTCLRDTEFQERINADLREAIDSLRPYYDPKYLDDESLKAMKMLNKGVSIRFSGRNGFLSIVVGYRTQGIEIETLTNQDYLIFDHAVTLTYDLFEQKRIERFSDLFYEGADFVPLLNNGISAGLGKYFLTETSEPQKIDFSGVLGEPELFTIDRVGFGENNPYFYHSPLLAFSWYGANEAIYDLSLVGAYRDMREVIDDIHAKDVRDQSYPEWIEDYYKEDGVFFTKYVGSRFHTDEEVQKENEIIDRVQHTAREYLQSQGFDFYHRIFFDKCGSYWCVYASRVSAEEAAYIDAETLEAISIEEMLGENWKQHLDEESRGYTDFNLSYFTRNDDTVTAGLMFRISEDTVTWRSITIPYDEVNHRYIG